MTTNTAWLEIWTEIYGPTLSRLSTDLQRIEHEVFAASAVPDSGPSPAFAFFLAMVMAERTRGIRRGFDPVWDGPVHGFSHGHDILGLSQEFHASLDQGDAALAMALAIELATACGACVEWMFAGRSPDVTPGEPIAACPRGPHALATGQAQVTA